MEIIKAILYIAASLVMLAAILFCPQVCGACSIFYVSILTSYLGMDVINMIKSTKLLPPGEFRELKIGRYVVSSISYAVLLGAGFYMSKKTGVNLDSMFSVFLSAVFLMVGILIGGLEGNKLVTE